MSKLHGHGASDSGEDFDLVADDITIELSRDPDGEWRFWGVRLATGETFGQNQKVRPTAGAALESMKHEP